MSIRSNYDVKSTNTVYHNGNFYSANEELQKIFWWWDFGNKVRAALLLVDSANVLRVKWWCDAFLFQWENCELGVKTCSRLVKSKLSENLSRLWRPQEMDSSREHGKHDNLTDKWGNTISWYVYYRYQYTVCVRNCSTKMPKRSFRNSITKFTRRRTSLFIVSC